LRWATAVLLVTATAACNSSVIAVLTEDQKSPSQVIADAKADTRHLQGGFEVQASGTDSNGVTALFDVHVDGKGNMRGSGTLNGAQVDLVVLGGKLYMKGHDFWARLAGAQGRVPNAQVSAILQQIDDRWVLNPSSAGFGDFAKLTASTLADCLDDHGTLSKAGTDTVNGKKAVVLNDKGDAAGVTPGKVYIAFDSPHYLLETTEKGKQTQGTVKPHGTCPLQGSGTSTGTSTAKALFQNYGESVTIETPPNPLDLAQLFH
jgi:hypothetical protein